MTILVFASHNDDQITGAGGALAHYSKQGERVVTVICSYGENSHRHLKKKLNVKRKLEEALKANKTFGGADVIFLGIREGNFAQDLKTRSKLIKNLIAKEKPDKVFTHSGNERNPDHKALNKHVLSLADKGTITCPVYSFSIWSVFNLSRQNHPALVVETTKTFQTKIKAFLANERQTLFSWAIIWTLMIKDRICGIANGCRYAEAFYKLR